MTTLPDQPPLELEDDVAELVCALASGEVQDEVFCRAGNTEAAKQQFRDALTKLIDERIAAALKPKCDHEWRDPLMHEMPCDMSAEVPRKVCALCGEQRG